MSKWDLVKSSKAKVSSGGMFSPANDSYQTMESSNKLIDAAAKVSREIQRSFDMCDRLPKQPLFTTKEGVLNVEESVLGAIGEAAVEILDLSQSNKCSSSIGLGKSGLNSSNDNED